MAGTTGLEPATSAVTGQLDVETQALTGSTEEHNVLKTRRREFLLFPRCSYAGSVGPKTKSADGLATDAVRTTDVWFRRPFRTKKLTC